MGGLVHADTVTLTNGDGIRGKVTRPRAGKFEGETVQAGTVCLDVATLGSVGTAQPVTLVPKDYTCVIGRLAGGEGRGLLVVPVDGTEPWRVESRRVTALLPMVLTEHSWRVPGRVGLGVSDVAGNTEVYRLDTVNEGVARRGRDRNGTSVRTRRDCDSRCTPA